MEKRANRTVQRLRERVKQGDAEAAATLATRYATGDGVVRRSLRSAVSLYRIAAAQGHADAQYNLAVMLLLGEGVTPDAVTAIRLLTDAAANGSSDAQLMLAHAHLSGRYGVKKSSGIALAYFIDTMRAGDMRGLRDLLACVQNGDISMGQVQQALQ